MSSLRKFALTAALALSFALTACDETHELADLTITPAPFMTSDVSDETETELTPVIIAQPETHVPEKITAVGDTAASAETPAPPETEVQPETTAPPETEVQTETTAPPETEVQPETTVQPETAAPPETTAQPETTAPPETTSPPVTASNNSDAADSVYWVAGGEVWHIRSDCSSLSRSKNIKSGSVSDAVAAGKARVCKRCGKSG